MRILIIDDEEFVRLVLEQALRAEGCEVAAAKDGRAGIEALNAASYDCVITDLRMPGIDGRGVLQWVKEHQPDVDVLMLTGHGDVKDAVEAIKQGAWDFLVKDTPFDGAAVKAALAKLRTVRELRRENLAARHGGYRHDVIVEGPSRAWRELKARITRVAPSQAPVLIQGETGSGKEIVARLLHELSPRSAGPFIAINCGAVSRELLESELFGHEKGAFTGATASTPGLIAAAAGGTLFLDELGEMPAAMQVSLLRFLDRGEYRPVGSTRTLRADVRIVGATNQDLQQSAAAGRFRQDLLYRLNTVALLVPPLRERTDDLPALIDHILHTLRVPGAPTRTMSPDALPPLAAYPWPGNIRELRNVIERAVLLSPGTAPLTKDDIEHALPPSGHAPQTDDLARLSLDDIERRHIARVLKATDGNKTQAARILRIDYKTLLTKLKQYEG
ncbi:sigma-54-dependent transcriptional regulator [Nitrospira moscoviensis]|uniref:Transcriptional regulatory protein ZraR n=1 Tax=Nitrospira moscoviensis TaxID=42253 RepID=A0A0K2GBJ1_NITMO|nr:sigma-54 dependent transcriptional regulator [Nitrospira moscoviensis]ALA57947.1 Transcriptional regulatory protein ZraR [Nitrospira moscoviensis]